VPALIITYWFYSREAIAGHEAATQVAKRQAAENQLKLLESQLEPHMLFNTLANLRVLIGIDPPRAQAMLDQLIAFLRATLSASRSASHPLEAEFARLRDYLALMELRMGERLQARFDLPAELAGLPLPPLLLQAAGREQHQTRLEPKVEGGRIEVRAARDADDLVLQVRDTGVGLNDAASDGTRFGLTQVRERLATLYGTRASLSLARAPMPKVERLRRSACRCRHLQQPRHDEHPRTDRRRRAAARREPAGRAREAMVGARDRRQRAAWRCSGRERARRFGRTSCSWTSACPA